MKLSRRTVVLGALVLTLGAGRAAVAEPAAFPVKAEAAWVRSTVARQQSTGAFMRLTSPAGAKLVAVSSPVAGRAELHEMRMEGNVMRMREVPAVALPPGKPVDLKPGGHHVMLLELKQALADGQTVPLILEVEDKAGRRSKLTVEAVARLAPPAAAHHSHGGHAH